MVGHAVFVEEVTFGSDRNHGAHGVEEIGEHNGEGQHHHGNNAELLEGPHHGEASEGGEVGDLHRGAVEGGRPAVPTGHVAAGHASGLGNNIDDHGRDGRGHDADEERAGHPAQQADRGEEEAEYKDGQRPGGDGAVDPEGHYGAFAGADEAGVDQPNQGDEEPQAHRNGGAQELRHRPENGFTQARHHEQRDDDAFNNDNSHTVSPGHSGHLHDDYADDGIEAQPGGHGEREIGDDAGEQRHEAGHNGGAGGDGREVRALGAAAQVGAGGIRTRQDNGVKNQDVGHGHEGDQPAAQFAGHGGPAFAQPEKIPLRLGGCAVVRLDVRGSYAHEDLLGSRAVRYALASA